MIITPRGISTRDFGSSTAEDLMINIYNAAADFCGDDFNGDVTILVVKCNFDGSWTVSSQNIPPVGAL
jgi:hypothetical protein